MVDRRKILPATLWAVALSVLGNILVRLIAAQFIAIDPRFQPLGWGPIVFWTVVLTGGAGLVLAALARFTRQPLRVFFWVAVAFLLISFIPDWGIYRNQVFPGTTAAQVWTLVVMHIVAGVITIAVLTTRTRAA